VAASEFRNDLQVGFMTSQQKAFPIRLTPGQDLRAALEAAVLAQNCRAAFVLSGIGSLSTANIRLAGADQSTLLTQSMEILTLSGTLAARDDKAASHMHMAISTATGQVLGGHVAPGCIVLTTAEVLLVLLPDWQFTREPDVSTGYDELVIQPRS
jgi:predicted DNA-binding protein with PD1-like motif